MYSMAARWTDIISIHGHVVLLEVDVASAKQSLQ
jgi:hypothetical protein